MLIAQKIFDLLVISAGISFFFAGFLTAINKLYIRDFLIIHSPTKLIAKILECTFCLTHHVVFVFVCGIQVVDFDFSLFFLPLICATITSKLTE